MPRGYPGSMAPHGTLTRYTTHKCRCDECKASWRDYHRRVRGCRPLEVYNAERAAKHGTEAKYRNGCRCDACRAASSAARRSRRAADREATNAYEREYRREYRRRKKDA
jgi:hypothetical protein